MANLYSYEIGATYAARTNLEALTTPVPAPHSSFTPYSASIPLGSGAIRGGGWARVVWRWGFLTRAQRDQLRTFCTAKSATVNIRTRKNDSTDAYTYYTAIMVWPEAEDRDHGYRIDFEIEFRNCVVYTP